MAWTPSLVHTVESSVRPPEIRPSQELSGHSTFSYQERLRSKCTEEWRKAVLLYQLLDKVEHRERSWNLQDCRTRAWFIRHTETGQVSVVANHCGLRWCPLCAQARSNYIRHSLSEWLSHADHPKFLTLTLKHSSADLVNQVTRLYDSFRNLRRSKDFKKLVTGGVWFFQLCRNAQRGEWHPHLHCIVTGRYIPYQYLRKRWLEITGDSDVVDIRIITDPERVASEVARYASRPAQLSNFGMKLSLELYDTMHGRTLCGKWGRYTKVELSVKRNPDMKDWEKIGSWSVVTEYARTNAAAKKILEAYESREPLAEGISLQTVDDFIDGDSVYKPDELTIDLPPPKKNLFDS